MAQPLNVKYPESSDIPQEVADAQRKVHQVRKLKIFETVVSSFRRSEVAHMC